MKALVTICARKKREDAGLMPAYLRYDAPHVMHTYEEAKRLGPSSCSLTYHQLPPA